jgi:hypothetical protein
MSANSKVLHKHRLRLRQCHSGVGYLAGYFSQAVH